MGPLRFVPSRPACAALLLVLFAAPLPAQEGENGAAPIDLHGFFLAGAALRTTGEGSRGGEGGDMVLAEARLRLEAEGKTESGTAYFLAKADGSYDAITGEWGAGVREAYGGLALGPWDLRLGRHVITWGAGDLFYVNDVFPKDWGSFFSGRPAEYLKLGVDGLRARLSLAWLDAELVAASSFRPDELPPPERFVYSGPPGAAPGGPRELPRAGGAGIEELAVRVGLRPSGWDVSLYAYRGYWRTPSLGAEEPSSPQGGGLFFPGLSTYGASLQRNFAGGVLSLEAGRWDSRKDRGGDDPAIPNSQWRFLAGYQREVAADFTAGVQAYGELMEDYGSYSASLAPGQHKQSRLRGVFSARLTKLFDYQSKRLSLFAAYSPTDGDYFMQPEAFLSITDNLAFTVGASVFGGSKDWTFFGQLGKSDNLYANFRVSF